jgi:hypothetical protein
MTARYAVILKIHYWDDFAERRLKHLLGKAGSGDVYLFVDETHGPVPAIPYDKIIRATERDMVALDVVLHPPGRVFWYSVDYPLYYFYLQKPAYNYYLMCEHDAVFNIDIDAFVAVADHDHVDYVGFPLAKEAWPIQTCDGVYPPSFKLAIWLSCISLHSKRAVKFLFERRQSLALRYNNGEFKSWPNNEAFLPTEMLNNGFVVRTLGDFGKVERYDWWPPTHEDDLPKFVDQAFLHPVLDERRYVASCVQQSNPWSYLSSDSRLRRLLGDRPPLSVAPLLLKEIFSRFVRWAAPAHLLTSIRAFRGKNVETLQRLIHRVLHAN